MGAVLNVARAHPDALGLLLVVGLALLLRGQFVFRAPMFMQHDSIGYFLPAYDLANGEGFGVGFRRTPTYPLFLAGVLAAFGNSLAGILIVQHLLGAVTAGLTYWLGRITLGRPVGLIGGLLAALNGALIVGEHYLMSEALFIPLLALSLLVLIYAGQSPSLTRYLVAGLLLGATSLCRPIAQVLFPLVPVALLLLGRRPLEVVRGTALVAAGVMALMLPWTARNCLLAGECSTVGVLGQAMIARTAYYDKGFAFYMETDPDLGPNAPHAARRRLIQQLTDRGNVSGGEIARRLQVQFNWTDDETSRNTREAAFEVIKRQPLHYLWGTLGMFVEIYAGEFERLRTDWKTQGRRFSRDEWPDRVKRFLANPTVQQEAEFPRAEAVVQSWQPAYWTPWLPLLSLTGFVFALRAHGPARGAAVLGLASVALMLTAAAFNGPVPRYRYPVDPYVGLLAAGAVWTLVQMARSGEGDLHPLRPAERVATLVSSLRKWANAPQHSAADNPPRAIADKRS
jgi:4-amino-4-deoxy-L-arabinose transferase-like glycosyltransferase